MDHQYPQAVIVQYRVSSFFGTDAEFDRRCQMEDLLDEVLRGSGNGVCDGGDSGCGGMNIFLLVKEAKRAIPVVLDALKKHDLLHDVIVAESIEEADEVIGHKVWWPENFTGKFSIM